MGGSFVWKTPGGVIGAGACNGAPYTGPAIGAPCATTSGLTGGE